MTIIGAAAGVTMALSFRIFFRYPGDFGEAIRFWFTPDLFSALKGEYMDDWWNELKLSLWLGLGFAAGFGAFQLLEEHPDAVPQLLRSFGLEV